MKNKKTNRLELILENLFNPINNKDYGKYWNVGHSNKKPLANASELLSYIRKEEPEGSFINRYANLTSDLILENNIYLDFDLTNNSYLKAERSLTEATLEDLAGTELTITEKTKPSVKANNEFLKQIQQKYRKNFSVENGFTKGFNNFIDSLTTAETGALKKLVAAKEKEEVKGLSEKEIQKYYLNKFEQDYLKEPFKEAKLVAEYFNYIGVETVLNWSGSKGLHLRIPITIIDFSEVPELAENPEAVKIFLLTMAELIETKILKKAKGSSSLDYAVFKKGMQRLPTSKHNKTFLYANFIEPSTKYLEAIDYLEEKVPSYIPNLIDTAKNTEALVESDIYKATVKKALEEATKTFKSEKENPNYKFNGQHKELKEIISKVYLPSVRNEIGFRIVHLLRRSNFSQEEVEDIFKELHEDYNDYKETIQGSIIHAYKTEKLVGLRSLIKWLKANASAEVKDEVIKYFSRKFNYFDRPEETVLEDSLNIANESYKVIFQKSKTTEKYIVPEFIAAEFSLELELKKHIILKHKTKPIAKLELNRPSETSDTTIKAKSEKKLKEFIQQILNKNIVPTDKEEAIQKFKEVITELDLIIGYFRIQQEQEEELQLMEEEIAEDIEEDEINFTFGRINNTYYKQEERLGIVKITENKDSETVLPVANVVIKKVEIVLDSLGILEPVYNVTYYNKTFNEEVTVNYLTKKQLIQEFITANVFYISTKETVETILNIFIIEGTKEDRIKTKTESYLEGYFIVNNHVVSNTKLNNIKKPTAKELAEAIKLLNDIMKDRTAEGKANDSAVYRFMLWNPFSYCLKQLGYSKANYSLILIGKSQTNKTGATKIGNLFYNHVEEETTGSTVSVLGSKLGENSFTSIFDECSHLFYIMEALNVMKRAIYERTGRAVKDRNDNTKIDEFIALNLPLFILNERIDLKDYITNRYKVINYSSESYISDSAIAKFNEKYVPEAEDTILKKLALIGKVFSEKLIAIIEDPTERKKLFNIEELTIEILKEMQEEAGVKFNPEMLKTTVASDKYNYDVATEIKSLLNTEFKKRINKHDNYYIASDFKQAALNSNFNFLIYDSKKQKFLIRYSDFNKFINENIEEYVELEEILDILDLKQLMEQEAKGTKFSNWSDYIRKSNRIGSKVHKGFYLDIEDLAYKVFRIQLSEETD